MYKKLYYTCKKGVCGGIVIESHDSGARGRGFDTYLRGVVSLSKVIFTPRKVLVILSWVVNRAADLCLCFRAKSRFSHDAAYIVHKHLFIF